MSEPPQKRKRHSFGGDQRLLPRVRQVLSENDDLDAEGIVAKATATASRVPTQEEERSAVLRDERAGDNRTGRPATRYRHCGARRSRRQ
ncbi:hypothetical protein MTO96_049343 [Rhipicephalus appendiculatus]